MYGDKILIQDINGQKQVDDIFEDVYDDSIYTIIDKESLGQSIGRRILDEEPEFDPEDECNIVFEEIDKEIINDIVQCIYDYVYEYIMNNE